MRDGALAPGDKQAGMLALRLQNLSAKALLRNNYSEF